MADGGSGRALIQKPHILLVEGPDDRIFFETLAAKLVLRHSLQIIELSGRGNLRARLNAVVTLSRTENIVLRSVGIALDCETNADATAHMIRDAFGAVSLPIPTNALIASRVDPQTAYMLFPDAHAPGMLEDLCLRAFINDPAFTCVDEYFDCLSQQDSFLSYSDASKARVRAYLASKERAETRLGIAAQKNWWPWNDPAFDEAKRFLELMTAI